MLTAFLLAIPAPHRVLLVIDTNNLESLIVGNYYKDKRSIPDTNVLYVGINVIDRNRNYYDAAAATRLTNDLLWPILNAIDARGLSNTIDYIALSYGIPIRCRRVGGSSDLSTASYIASWDGYSNDNDWVTGSISLATVTNRNFSGTNYYTNSGKVSRYRLVSHLAGYSVDDVKRGIDNAVTGDGTQVAAKTGRWVLQIGPYSVLPQAEGTNLASNWNTAYGIPSSWFAGSYNYKTGNVTNVIVMLHGGTYSGYNPGNYLTYMSTNMALPGAYGEAHESYGCVPDGFFETRAQTQFPEALYWRLNYSTFSGAVAEPYLGFMKASAYTNASENFRNLFMQGFTSLEAAYFTSWRDVRGPTTFVGDVLSRPFAVMPSVAIASPVHGSAVHGTVSVNVSASISAGSINGIELYVDGKKYTNASGASLVYGLDTAALADGEHTVYAVAYDNTALRSAGWKTAVMIVTNSGVMPPPAAPKDIARLAAASSTNTVAISWADCSANETEFRIYRSLDNITYALAGTVSAGVTVFTNTGLTTNVKYWYRISATNANGESAFAGPLSFTIVPPNPPSTVAFSSIGSNFMTVTWSGSGVTNEFGFNVYRSTNDITYSLVQCTTIDTTWFYNSGLLPNTTYYYKISATNEYGESALAGPAMGIITPPAQVTNVRVTGTNNLPTNSYHFVIAWDDTSTNEVAFKVYQSTNNTNYSIIGYTTSNAVCFTNYDMLPNTSYYFKVAATNKFGESVLSSNVKASIPVPQTPSGLVITLTNAGALALSWTDTATNENGFAVWRGIDNTGYTIIGSVGANVSVFTDATYAPGPAYTYKVAATNSYGSSLFTMPVSPVDLSPAMPSNLTYSLATWEIRLAWKDIATNESGYIIYQSTDGVTYSQLDTAVTNATNYSDMYNPAGTYYYKVCATNTFGVSALAGPVVVNLVDVPAATGVTATILNSNSVVVTWTDNAANESNYVVYRSGVYYTNAANTVCFTNTGLATNTTYWYYILAKGGYFETWSSGTNVRIVVVPPADPTGLAVAMVSSTNALLSWTDNATNETGMNIYRSTNGISYDLVATVTTNATNYYDTTVVPGKTYFYRIAATNVFGESALAGPAVIAPPADLSALAVTMLSPTNARISWSDNASNESGMNIYRSTNGITYVLLATAAVNATNYIDTTIAYGSAYYYRAAATNSFIESARIGPVVIAPPAEPSGLSVQPISTNSARLSWTDNASNESGVTVYRSTNGVSYTLITTASANATNYIDTGMLPNIVYYYKIAATNVFCETWRIGPVTAMLSPPANPTGLSAVLLSATNAVLSWIDNASNESGVCVYRSTNGVTYTLMAALAANTTNTIDTGLSFDVTCYYKIAVTNMFGTSALVGPVSVTPVRSVTITDGIVILNPVENNIGITYTLTKNCGDTATAGVSWSIAGLGVWQPVSAAQIEGALSHASNGICSNTWVLPPSFDFTKRYDIRITATIGTNAAAPFIITNIDMGSMFKRGDDLGGVCAVNNPYRGDGDGIGFVNLTVDTEVKIYTVSGKYVTTLEKPGDNGRVVWRLTGSGGRRVSPGVYLCRMTAGSEKKLVKVIVLR
ncbi:MAG: T9SS type A sorting domain-containing protein [Spirochaetes bacterium]|nr:T9SS type A sorting domain-containing protein [Spirochaetota bacterium]